MRKVNNLPHTNAIKEVSSANPASRCTYSDITDYILGITFEIWEQRQVDAILDYYSEDIEVFSLEGMTHGAAGMVKNTHATLAAYPDRLLLGDDVIWSGDMARGFSSHRITSPMTNLGDTAFGPATGKQVLLLNIADCEVTDGKISREWLVRDNLSLIMQLGFDTGDAAVAIANGMDEAQIRWLQTEFARVSAGQADPMPPIGETAIDSMDAFVRKVLGNCWVNGDQDSLQAAYAPYCVLQRSAVRIHSGREEVLRHYAQWRAVFPDAKLSVDHVCSQPFSSNGCHIAVRWSIAGHQQAPFAGHEAHGDPVYIVGVTHWRLVNGRIVAEWTVFDELAMIAQSITGNR